MAHLIQALRSWLVPAFLAIVRPLVVVVRLSGSRVLACVLCCKRRGASCSSCVRAVGWRLVRSCSLLIAWWIISFGGSRRICLTAGLLGLLGNRRLLLLLVARRRHFCTWRCVVRHCNQEAIAYHSPGQLLHTMPNTMPHFHTPHTNHAWRVRPSGAQSYCYTVHPLFHQKGKITARIKPFTPGGRPTRPGLQHQSQWECRPSRPTRGLQCPGAPTPRRP